MPSLFDDLPEDNAPSADGDQLRDLALNRLRAARSALVRRLMGAFLQHLIDNGPDTSDAVRALVPIPVGVDPRVTGAAIRGLAERGLIASVGRRKSGRGVAHARKLDVWAVADLDSARLWLATHPNLDPVAGEEVACG
jgi:hypothetical protein